MCIEAYLSQGLKWDEIKYVGRHFTVAVGMTNS